MRRKDISDLRMLTREITQWAREMDLIFQPPSQPAAPAPAALPPGYSLVTCKRCSLPAILLRERKSFAAFCMSCRSITHLDAIDAELPK